MKKFTFSALALAAVAAMPFNASADDELIVSRPEGELHTNMVWNSTSFYEYQGTALQQTVNERAPQVVVNGTDFYLYNPFTGYPTGTWLKGTIDEQGNVTIPTPQIIYQEDNAGYVSTFYANRMIPGEAPNEFTVVYELDMENTGIHFIFRNNTLTQTDPTEVMLGMTTAAGEWAKYGEKDILCDPLEKTSVAPADPSKLTMQLFSLQYHLQDTPQAGKIVELAVDGNEAWLHNVTDIVEDCWIKGTVENGNKITFSTEQFLGAGEGYWRYFMAGTSEKVWSDYLNKYYYNHKEGKEIVFNLQDDGKWTTAEDATMFINIGDNGLQRGTMQTMQNPSLTPYKAIEDAPKEPSIIDYSQYKPSDYCGFVRFQILPETSKGEYLNPNQIYYEIFFDDSNVPETFTKEEYAYLPVESITEIPFYFSDGTMIYKDANMFTFVFYPQGLQSIGIMAYTKSGEGKNFYSNISWINLNNGSRYSTPYNADSIDGIEAAEGSEVEAYFDLAGKRVENPENGIYIARLKNGKSVKVAVTGK